MNDARMEWNGIEMKIIQSSAVRDAMTAPTTVRASHVLVKHANSRRPASWRDPDGEHISKRTKEAAIDELVHYRAAIENGTCAFEDVAREVSDCSSAKRGGDLGEFGRGAMQRAFEEATYALGVGEMSGVVETDSGVHVILRTG